MMKIISHRGNLSGPKTAIYGENNVQSILHCINLGFDVEIDVWRIDAGFYLGHDNPQSELSLDFLMTFNENLWIHCKNLLAISELRVFAELNYFWHEEDVMTLTSKNDIWVYPGNQPVQNSVAVLPEIHDDDITNCTAICTDYPFKYVLNEDK